MSKSIETDRSRAIQDQIRRVYPFVWSLRPYGMSLPELALIAKGAITWARLYLGVAVPRQVGRRPAVSRRMLAVIAVVGVVLGFGLVSTTRITLNGLASIAPSGASGAAVAPAVLPTRTNSPVTGRGIHFGPHRTEARWCRASATS